MALRHLMMTILITAFDTQCGGAFERVVAVAPTLSTSDSDDDHAEDDKQQQEQQQQQQQQQAAPPPLAATRDVEARGQIVHMLAIYHHPRVLDWGTKLVRMFDHAHG